MGSVHSEKRECRARSTYWNQLPAAALNAEAGERNQSQVRDEDSKSNANQQVPERSKPQVVVGGARSKSNTETGLERKGKQGHSQSP